MHKLTFFPLGNADCCRIDLNVGEKRAEKLLVDYADTRDSEDPDDKRCDLPTLLRDDLDTDGRDAFDVVAFTHLDQDHYKGASEFFWLEHAKKYQSEDRIKIGELWVPAGLIVETGTTGEARVIQAEARYRFKNGNGIQVFGRPKALEDYCEEHDIPIEDRKVTIAGQLALGFTKTGNGVEFFVHSPFAWRVDEDTLEDRNNGCLVVHATFLVGKKETKTLLLADAEHEAMRDMAKITRKKGNEARFEWDVTNIGHHCSYGCIGPEKGDDQTEPIEEVQWVYDDQQLGRGLLISNSKPIPKKGSDEDKDKQPPHRQAANYYKSVVEKPSEDFRVTMSYPPGAKKPQPIVIEIDDDGATLLKETTAASVGIISGRGERQG